MNYSDIINKLHMVHASNYLWPDATLRPYSRIVGYETNEVHETFNFRLTVHFSIGSLVPPHSKVITWEDCLFAIVTPMKNLLPQLASVYAYDSFIVGPWTVKPGTFLIAPHNSVDDITQEVYHSLGCGIIFYDPDIDTIREMIDLCIKDDDGILLHLLPLKVIAGTHAYIKQYPPLEDVNVNTPEFFQELFNVHPEICFGSDVQTIYGKNATAYCLGSVKQLTSLIIREEKKEKPNMIGLILYSSYLDFMRRLLTKEFAKQFKEKIKNILIIINRYKKNWKTTDIKYSLILDVI